MTIEVVSTGMGVQTTALLCLAAQERIDYRTFLFANVGDDSENPKTLAYFKEVAIPYAARHGLELVELQKTRFGEEETLYQRLTRPGSRSIGLPVRMSGSGAPGNRACTADFKIKVVDKELKKRDTTGAIKELRKAVLKRYDVKTIDKEVVQRLKIDLDAFFQENEPAARVAIGISLDEIQRMKPNLDPDTIYWKVNDFPLIKLRMTRQDCINVIRKAGIKVPDESSCFFCPFHTLDKWQDMRQNDPENFWKTCDLEKIINERRAMLGLDPVWFSRKLRPLAEATTELEQGTLFDDVGCDSGYCWT